MLKTTVECNFRGIRCCSCWSDFSKFKRCGQILVWTSLSSISYWWNWYYLTRRHN